MHERGKGEEERVLYGELVSRNDVGFVLEVPFVGRRSTDDEKNDADKQIGDDHADPDLLRQRCHEREHAGLLLLGLANHDRYAEIDERLGEVHRLLAGAADGQRGDRQVRIAIDQCTDHSVPHALLDFIAVFGLDEELVRHFQLIVADGVGKVGAEAFD